ncbi:MAG: stage V sporulation protein D [Oscillospiraceae bacterium]|nr:stage V sporulation protein D [Oscillospiraceae bacterium]
MAKGVTVRMWRRALLVLIILLVGGFGVSIFRLVEWQLIQGKDLQQMAMAQQLKDIAINAKRGTIYDKNMKPLAQSVEAWTVILEPVYLKSDESKNLVATGLSEILMIDKDEILQKMRKESFYEIIKRKIENSDRDKILAFKKDNKISNGIRIIDDTKRCYPCGCLASTVIGFTGLENQGLSGIENYYDQELTGKPGRVVTAKNAIGMDIPCEHEQSMPAQNGRSLVLSIDEYIQGVMEKYLEAGRVHNNVVNGAVAIMMDVNNGEILGMATEGYDLNNPFDIKNEEEKARIETLEKEERSKAEGEALQKQWRNKAISDTYMPGSTFKMITAAMGLEEDVVNEGTRFNCSGGFRLFNKEKTVHCHKREGHGSQSFLEAICHSCNPAFIALGQSLGAERFYKYYRDFGLTQETGVDLPGEANGIFFSKDGTMQPMSLVVASFGQNFSITPIQLITAVSAVANGGKLVKPHVVKQIIDDSHNIVKIVDKNVKRQVISKQTSQRLRKMLQKNVEVGSGRNGNVPGFQIFGKTGTAEKIGQSGQDGKDYIASYCGCAPADDPQIALLVIYDTPKGKDYYGSAVAAPTFRTIMEEVLPHLGVRKKFTNSELLNAGVSAPLLIGCSVDESKEKLSRLGLKVQVSGPIENKVVSQNPKSGIIIPKGGTVLLSTDSTIPEQKVAVPNFVGLTLSQVEKLASLMKLNVCVSGATNSGNESKSVRQNIKLGTEVSQQTVITVEFIQRANIF